MTEVTEEIKESLRLIEDLKFFLATAPANWQENQVIRRYYLNNDEGFVSCVFWNNLYFITGTDIVRCILYKFQHFGRNIVDRKKFEEGIFSDLRNLKLGTDSVLENPKLAFLDFLFKNSCLRTQKKQKVFFWFNVPHDKLMADALERDIKREKLGQQPTSVAVREPALLFNYVEDKSRTLYEQLGDYLNQPQFENLNLEDDQSECTASNSSSEKGDPSNALSTISQDQDEYAYRELAHNEEDDDDDFPLDYLDKEFGLNYRDKPGRDYISFDGNYHSSSFINASDSNFDTLDQAMFQSSVNLVSNDDYLIEQTIPAKMPGSSSQPYLPRLAKCMDDTAFLQPSGMAPAYGYPYPHAMAPMPSASYESGYFLHDTSPHYHHPHEEYYHPQLTPLGPMAPMAPMVPMLYMEPQPAFPGYYADPDTLARGYIPSQRQQDVSASMMRKRQQLQGRNPKVTKPSHSSRFKPSDFELRVRKTVKLEPDDALPITTTDSTGNAAAIHPDQNHYD